MNTFNIKSNLSKGIYSLIKPILFKIDAEKIHEAFVNFGQVLGANKITRKLVSKFFGYENPALEQNILGINFKNPIGLAAGFDYEGKLTQILPSVGFGFHTIGSITLKEYKGNPPPRLARLPKSNSILVNKGLKNSGVEKILDSIKGLDFKIPLGIGIAKTNSKQNSEDEKAIDDYYQSLKICEGYKLNDYYEINISCPNSHGGEEFITPKKLSSLLTKVNAVKTKKPLFLKMPINLSTQKTNALCKIALKHNVQGLIFGNLTKDRKNPFFDKKEIEKAGRGNFSGRPTYEIGNRLISFVYKKYKGKFIIIGCGGIFSAENAYEKIKLGANLVQLVTGMIFKGPSLISDINHGVVKLLYKDGFSNISEAVGSAHTKLRKSRTS